MNRSRMGKGIALALALGSLTMGLTGAQGEPSQRQLSGPPVVSLSDHRAGQPTAFEDCCRAITEGEFALFFVRALVLDVPPGGWSEELAVAALARLGYSPRHGWQPSRVLTEAVLREIVAGTRFAASPAARRVTNAAAPVTVARARAVFTDGVTITLGEFARLVAQTLSPQSVSTGDEQDALALLLRRRILPATGWSPRDVVTEKTMRTILERARLLPPMQTDLFREGDALPVDYTRAVTLVQQRRSLLTQGMVALLLVKLSGGASPAGNWTVERAIAELEKFHARPEYGWIPTAPICRSDFARLMRRAGVILPPAEECQVVAGHPLSPEPRSTTLAEVIARITPTAPAPAPRIPTRSIFGPSGEVTLVAPIPARAVGPPVQMPVTPVPPEGIGPEIPSTFSQTPPRSSF
ncbi:MAG TPA: hypothetical protein VNM72_06005 [Blastocatellia bacterium]|nr:hypothetical protein [Blastocatellia bacterium]